MLSDNAQYLGRLGQTVKDVNSLWQFEVEQAIGFSPVPTLASVTDIQVDAPGLPITFTRVFSTSTVGRYDQGPLGRGWAWSDGWDRSLTTEADGTVVVSGIDGHERRFEPDSRTAGVYFSQDGDHATLSGLARRRLRPPRAGRPGDPLPERRPGGLCRRPQRQPHHGDLDRRVAHPVDALRRPVPANQLQHCRPDRQPH